MVPHPMNSAHSSLQNYFSVSKRYDIPTVRRLLAEMNHNLVPKRLRIKNWKEIKAEKKYNRSIGFHRVGNGGTKYYVFVISTINRQYTRSNPFSFLPPIALRIFLANCHDDKASKQKYDYTATSRESSIGHIRSNIASSYQSHTTCME